MKTLNIAPLIAGACLLMPAAQAQDANNSGHQKGHEAHDMQMTDRCALPMGEGVINALDVKNAA